MYPECLLAMQHQQRPVPGLTEIHPYRLKTFQDSGETFVLFCWCPSFLFCRSVWSLYPEYIQITCIYSNFGTIGCDPSSMSLLSAVVNEGHHEIWNLSSLSVTLSFCQFTQTSQCRSGTYWSMDIGCADYRHVIVITGSEMKPPVWQSALVCERTLPFPARKGTV